MEFDDVVRTRRSIRGYLDKPVPQELIREILEIAMRAPTSMKLSPAQRSRATLRQHACWSKPAERGPNTRAFCGRRRVWATLLRLQS